MDNVDQDESGSIEFVEFLTHSLTEKHLTDQNIKVFFEVMLPFEYDPSKNNKSMSTNNAIAKSGLAKSLPDNEDLN